MATWKTGDETCPECKLHTEVLSDNELDYAERCLQCDWLIRFDEDNEYFDVEGDWAMPTWGLYRHYTYEATPQGKQFRAFEQLASPHELTPRQWLSALARWRHWTAKIVGDKYHGQLYDWMQPIYDNLIRQGYIEPRPKWSTWVQRQGPC